MTPEFDRVTEGLAQQLKMLEQERAMKNAAKKEDDALSQIMEIAGLCESDLLSVKLVGSKNLCRHAAQVIRKLMDGLQKINRDAIQMVVSVETMRVEDRRRNEELGFLEKMLTMSLELQSAAGVQGAQELLGALRDTLNIPGTKKIN
jgi:hypothetical protein